MSRSKKAPYFTEGQDSPGKRKAARRLANRRVRRDKDLASGSSFKKVSQSWDICDWKFIDKNNPKAKRK